MYFVDWSTESTEVIWYCYICYCIWLHIHSVYLQPLKMYSSIVHRFWTSSGFIYVIFWVIMQPLIWYSNVLCSTERCWPHLSSDQSATGQHDAEQAAMAARQQRPAAASDGSAEAKRTDLRANEKKCCKWICFPSVPQLWRWNMDSSYEGPTCPVLIIYLCSP